MAKVTAPLLSATAAGTVFGSVSFVTRRGQAVAILKPTPKQRYTADQATARLVVATGAAMVSRVFRGQVGKAQGAAMTPLEYLRSVRVNPNTWATQFTQAVMPSGYATIQSEIQAFTELGQPGFVAWLSFNGDLSVPFQTVGPLRGSPAIVFGLVVVFMFARGLARAGYLDSLPLETPPEWDNS